MTPFRQLILPGDDGSDVWAVKRAYIKMNVSGSGTLGKTKHAGTAFVGVTERVQRTHGIQADGKYGKATHAVVAPHFDAYGAMIYRTAKIRKPLIPPVFLGGAQTAAQTLLKLHASGKYSADNPGDLRDIQATANGQAVWSQGGFYVHIDMRPLQLLVWLIEVHGYKIGTFALCSDHHWDGRHGHSGGLSVDISSINGVGVSSQRAKTATLAVARLIHAETGVLKPWQLICDGYGYMHDSTISALTIPSAGFYGYGTMSGHRNHIHVGYYR